MSRTWAGRFGAAAIALAMGCYSSGEREDASVPRDAPIPADRGSLPDRTTPRDAGPPASSWCAAPELVAGVADFAELRIAHGASGLVAAWATFSEAWVIRRAESGWSDPVAIPGTLGMSFDVDEVGTAWGTGPDVVWNLIAGGAVRTFAAPRDVRLALAPSDAPMIAWPTATGVGWGFFAGDGFTRHETATPGMHRNPVLPVPVYDDYGFIVLAREGIDVVSYMRGEVESVVRVADAAEAYGMRPAAGVELGARAFVAYKTADMSTESLMVAQVAAGDSLTSWTRTARWVGEPVLVDGGDIARAVFWIEGDPPTGMPTPIRLFASQFDGGAWLEPVELAEVEYDYMIPPFDAGAAENGDVVVVYLAADGPRARRFTGGEWQPSILLAPRGTALPAYFDVAGGDGSNVYVGWGEYEGPESRLFVACLQAE